MDLTGCILDFISNNASGVCGSNEYSTTGSKDYTVSDLLTEVDISTEGTKVPDNTHGSVAVPCIVLSPAVEHNAVTGILERSRTGYINYINNDGILVTVNDIHHCVSFLEFGIVDRIDSIACSINIDLSSSILRKSNGSSTTIIHIIVSISAESAKCCTEINDLVGIELTDGHYSLRKRNIGYAVKNSEFLAGTINDADTVTVVRAVIECSISRENKRIRIISYRRVSGIGRTALLKIQEMLRLSRDASKIIVITGSLGIMHYLIGNTKCITAESKITGSNGTFHM